MSKKFILSVSLILISTVLIAKQINVSSAQNIANRFLGAQTQIRNASQPSLNLVYTAKEETRLRSSDNQKAYYYVFNIGNNNGFIIVSADDINVPIIGYSKEGSYDPENLPDNFKTWMESVELGMANALSKGFEPSENIQSKWRLYTSRAIGPGPGEGGTPGEGSGDYLIKTKWNQDYPYNQLIPFSINGTSKPPTGCVATAMAQIMKYYNYPARGKKRTIAYSSIPAIDLTQYTYDWNNMLNEYYIEGVSGNTEAQKNAVALLMYHFGASAKMDYGITSGATTNDAVKALIEYFGYDEDIFSVYRNHYDNEEWNALIKKEINNQRPVYYTGLSKNEGHAFICDGYDENGLFHFNWGWGGYLDGYFSLDAPLEFIINQQITANIQPENEIEDEVEKYISYLDLLPSKSTYKRNESIKIYYVVQENTVHQKKGNYYSALYSMSNEFVSFITHVTSTGNKYDLIDRNVEPGNYKIKIVEKKSSGEYNLITQSKNVPDVVITVVNDRNNHCLTSDGLSIPEDRTNIGYPGKQFDIDLSINSFAESNIYIRILLTDKNNNYYYLNDVTYETIPLGNNQSYKYTCKIPENIPVGLYRIRPIAMEEGTNWDTIPSGNNFYKGFIDYEIYPNASSYKIEKFHSNNSLSVKRNESIRMYTQMTCSVHDISHAKNLKPALYDDNNNRICILEMTENSIKEGSHLFNFLSRIPPTVLPGNYKLKMVEQTDIDTYILAPVTESFIAESITVTDEILSHELNIYDEKEFYVENGSTLIPGELKRISISCVNYGNHFPFIGYYGAALTDENDNIKYVILSQEASRLNSGYARSTFLYGRLPNDLLPGSYKLRIVAKMEGTDWSFVNHLNNDIANYLNVTVVSTQTRSTTTINPINEKANISIYPNPVKDVLHITTSESAIKNITIIDMLGKIILTDDVIESEKNISVEHLPKNTYILKVETLEGQSVHKFNKY